MRVRICDIMERRFLAVGETATIAESLAALLREGVDEVYVVDVRGGLVGAVPDYELLKAALGGLAEEGPVGPLASRSVRTVLPEGAVDEVAPLFRDGRFRQLPVVAEGRLVGVLGRCAVLRCVTGRLDAAHAGPMSSQRSMGGARSRGVVEHHAVESA